MTNKPILGVSLYSFTNEWQQESYTIPSMLEKIVALNLGPAIEAVGFQSFREYPDISEEFARRFRKLLDEYELIPSCLGGNIDAGRMKDKPMSFEEMIDYTERQIISAVKLGFPVLRIQYFVGPKVLEKLEPVAAKHKVHIACEIHAPMSIHHPEFIEIKECYDRIGSEYLGFIPDFSSSMNHPPELYWKGLIKLGAAEALVEEAKEIWHSDRSTPEKFGALQEAGHRHNSNPKVLTQLNFSMTMFGNRPVDEWKVMLPYTKHIHGKFYEVNKDSIETSIPYPEIFQLLNEENYTGTISAEWEGQAFTEEIIGFEQTSAWRTMCNKLLAELE